MSHTVIKREKVGKELLRGFKEVAHEKNLACIHQAVSKHLAAIFDARAANIFLIDHSDPKLM